LAVDPLDLHKEALLCHAHFGSEDIQSGVNPTIKENALPTIFNCSPLPDELMVPYGKNLWSPPGRRRFFNFYFIFHFIYFL